MSRRDILPVISLIVFFTAVMFAVLVLSVPAKADQPTVEQYVGANGPRVCKVLDAFPNFDGIGGIADAIVAEGFSYYQAGEIEALSVITFCPKHLDLMRRYAGIPAQPDLGAVGGVFKS